MNWRLLATGSICLIVASSAGAQEEPVEVKRPNVIELFEDNAAFMIQNLENLKCADASVAEKSVEMVYSGDRSLSVSSSSDSIRSCLMELRDRGKPRTGAVPLFVLRGCASRDLASCCKSTPAPVLASLLLAERSEHTRAWGATGLASPSSRRKWELVTRDLFKNSRARSQ